MVLVTSPPVGPGGGVASTLSAPPPRRARSAPQERGRAAAATSSLVAHGRAEGARGALAARRESRSTGVAGSSPARIARIRVPSNGLPPPGEEDRLELKQHLRARVGAFEPAAVRRVDEVARDRIDHQVEQRQRAHESRLRASRGHREAPAARWGRERDLTRACVAPPAQAVYFAGMRASRLVMAVAILAGCRNAGPERDPSVTLSPVRGHVSSAASDVAPHADAGLVFIPQTEATDCGPAAIAMTVTYYGRPTTIGHEQGSDALSIR
jgi:hypothetical protein